MKKIFLILFTILLLQPFYMTANASCNYQHKPTYKERKEFDKLLETRLNLTAEQKAFMKSNRAQNKKEMEKIISKMQTLHDKIKNVYLIGLPKWQADLKTASMKTELYMLKQEADKIRLQNRKKFESILDENQKAEFEILKKELHEKRKN